MKTIELLPAATPADHSSWNSPTISLIQLNSQVPSIIMDMINSGKPRRHPCYRPRSRSSPARSIPTSPAGQSLSSLRRSSPMRNCAITCTRKPCAKRRGFPDKSNVHFCDRPPAAPLWLVSLPKPPVPQVTLSPGAVINGIPPLSQSQYGSYSPLTDSDKQCIPNDANVTGEGAIEATINNDILPVGTNRECGRLKGSRSRRRSARNPRSCNIAVQAQHSDEPTDAVTRYNNKGYRENVTDDWIGGVRALRDSHVRLVLRQLRHIERLNRALDCASISQPKSA